MSTAYSNLGSTRLIAIIVGVAKDKAAEKSTVAGQKANQVSVQYSTKFHCALSTLRMDRQAAAGAREGTRDFKQDVEKEVRK